MTQRDPRLASIRRGNYIRWGPHSSFRLPPHAYFLLHLDIYFDPFCRQLTEITAKMPASQSPYRLVEPHPSVPQNSRPAIHTARGGAGNVINLRNTHTTPSQTATGPASATDLDSRSHPGAFKSGRGGAGNTHSSRERAIFSFDEELERDLRRAAPVYHVGRGGRGNTICRSSSGLSSSESWSGHGYGSRSGTDPYCLTRKSSGGSSSTGTNSSTGSTGDRARDRAVWRLERTWGKVKWVA